MTESTLLLLIFSCIIAFVLVAHWVDKRILKKIKRLEACQIKKGILKRHFVKNSEQ